MGVQSSLFLNMLSFASSYRDFEHQIATGESFDRLVLSFWLGNAQATHIHRRASYDPRWPAFHVCRVRTPAPAFQLPFPKEKRCGMARHLPTFPDLRFASTHLSESSL